MIGLVGAGQIAAAAHLPAYAKLNVPVVTIFDVDIERAQQVAMQWGINCARTLDDLLSDPNVTIVDIAVPPSVQGQIIEDALVAGKHVLAQKPLAPTLAEAARLVEMADAYDRYLVVNQQMRWSPVVDTIRATVADGRVGSIQWLAFDLDLPMPPGRFAGWLGKEPRFVALLNTIHLLDSSRYLLGEPSSLLAQLRWRDPHLEVAGEVAVFVALSFPGGAQVWINDRRNAIADHRATFQVIGSNGALRGRFGLWTDYPVGVDDEIEYTSSGTPEGWQPVPVKGRWIPDAFTGPIDEMVSAVVDGTSPSIPGRDHLRTLALVEAVYDSAASGCRVNVET